MNKVVLSAAIGAGTLLAASSAHAVPIAWDFGVGTAGNLGPTTTVDQTPPVPSPIPIVATGYASSGGATTALFRKEAGGDETGLGLANDPTSENEISGTSFIQLDLTALHSPPLTSLTLSIMMGSTTGADEWGLFLSNTAGTHGASPDLTGTDELAHTIDVAGFSFLDVGAVAGNVLLSTLSGNVSVAAPEPATLALLGVGLLGLGLVRRRHG